MSNTVKITVLVENTAKGNLRGEHGLSYLIESEGSKMLFDTGQSDLIIGNAAKLGLGLGDVNSIVLSHGHYDHTGGLGAVLEQLDKPAELFLHPEALKPKYKRLPGREYKAIGIDAEAAKKIEESFNISKVTFTEEPTKVGGIFTVTSTVPRKNDFEDVSGPFYKDTEFKIADGIEDDQSLFFQSSKGVVVILGCCHSGVVNTLEYIAELAGSGKIHAVIGGMHLLHADEERLEKTMQVFEKYDVDMIAAGHCTGMKAVAGFWNRFKGKTRECCCGAKFEFTL